jgi:hypothetical protein
MALKLIFLTTALLAAAPATASIEPANDGSPPRVYCIRFAQDTGSRINRQECRTKKQWAQKGVNVDELTKK